MKRIGILGGTFDPPHNGHLILAEYTREELQLDHVLFVPVADHPHKQSTRLYVEHRLKMLELAIDKNPKFSISMVDVDRPGPHYSADTVSIIHEQYPDSELFFVMGGDNLRHLPTWRRAEDLYERCQLAVMKRADEKIAPDMHDEILPGLSKKVIIIDVPLLSLWVSSTHIVERLMKGKSVRYIVPDSVLKYIDENGLYRYD
ncbi:nicotinate-nucleotide adenylyltransferase [Anaerolineales bacterium]